MSFARGKCSSCHFSSCDMGSWQPVLFVAFMALQWNSMCAGTMEDRHMVLSAIVIYFGLAQSIPWLSECLDSLYISMSSSLCIWFVLSILEPIDFRKLWFKLVSMLRRRGMPRRDSSYRGKSQRGCSFQVLDDYEPHISPRVHVLVEALEVHVLNQKLAIGEDGSNIKH